MLVNVRAELLKVCSYLTAPLIVTETNGSHFKMRFVRVWSSDLFYVQGDFAANLKLLQRYPPVDAHAILHIAEELGRARHL
jgi:hypothetical protein